MAGDVLQRATGIAPWFVAELERLIVLEARLRAAGHGLDDELLVGAKRAGFGDRDIATLTGLPIAELRARRDGLGLHPGFAMVDTSAAEFAAETPYFYSTYAAAGSPPEAPPVARPAALVIGSGPVRIGQGIEFDYCAVQARPRCAGWATQAIMVNSNPETVSTDFDASSRLYFESLDAESVVEVLRAETVDGAPPDAFIQFGGQTPLGLAGALADDGITLRGLDLDAIDQTEERMRFAGLVDRLGIPQPEGGMASSVEEAFVVAERVGYPVIVRPVVRDRRPGGRLRLRPRRPGADHRPRGGRRRRATGAHRRVPRGHGARRRRDHRRRGRAHPGPDRARRARRRAHRATRSASIRRSASPPPTRSWWSTRSPASRSRSACAA